MYILAEDICIRCQRRERGGSFRVCGECYDLAAREAVAEKKSLSGRVQKINRLRRAGHVREDHPDRTGLWDNVVRLHEDR